MMKPTTRGKTKTEPTRATNKHTPKAKAKPSGSGPIKEAKHTEPRRRPGGPFNLKILFPKQPEFRKNKF
jgi:hypothetical protein